MALLLVVACGCGFTPSRSPGDGDGDLDGSVPGDGSVDPPTDGFVRDVTVSPLGLLNPVANAAVPIQLAGDVHYADHGSPDGSDIFVTTAAGDRLPHDIEAIAVADGDLLLWVSATVSAPETTFRLYYGGGAAPATSSPAWPTADAVWHMGTFDGSLIVDATGSGNDFTAVGGGSTETVRGVFGDALVVDQAQFELDDPIQLDHDLNESFTVLFWFRHESALSLLDSPFTKGLENDGPGYGFAFGAGNWNAQLRDDADNLIVLLFGNESDYELNWHQFGLVLDRQTSLATAFVDGVAVAQQSIDNLDSLSSQQAASVSSNANPIFGALDELRHYPFAASSEFVSLDYQLSLSSTVMVGPAEAL